MYTVHIDFVQSFFGRKGAKLECVSRGEAQAAMDNTLLYGFDLLGVSITEGELKGQFITDAYLSPVWIASIYIVEDIPF